MGNALCYKEKYKDAIKSYKKAVSLKEDFLDAYFNLGNAYYMIGKFQEAISNYKVCSKTDQYRSEVRFALVKMCVENPDGEIIEISKVKKYLDEFLINNYNYIHSLYYYGKIMEKEKDFQKAKEYYLVINN